MLASMDNPAQDIKGIVDTLKEKAREPSVQFNREKEEFKEIQKRGPENQHERSVVDLSFDHVRTMRGLPFPLKEWIWERRLTPDSETLLTQFWVDYSKMKGSNFKVITAKHIPDC